MYSRVLSFHVFGWMLLAIGMVVYLALPRIAFDTYMADQRLPISLAFMLIACGHLDIGGTFVRRTFATIFVAVLALRIFEVQAEWNEAARTSNSFYAAMQQIERGSKILVAYADPEADDESHNQILVHAACLAIIERSSLVTTAFTVVGKHILRARSDYRDLVDTEDGTPPSVNQLLEVAANPEMEANAYWGDWTADYDYVYFLFTGPDHQNPHPLHLATRYVGERFVLYRVLPPDRSEETPETQESPATEPGPQVVNAVPPIAQGSALPRLRIRSRVN
jgi:hypothetical protein